MSSTTNPDLSNSQANPTCHIGMLLLPEFNSMATNAFIDPYRAANYLRGHTLYKWHFLSLEGKAVIASNGLEISNAEEFSNKQIDFDFIVINASWTPEKYQSKKLQQWLKACADTGATLVSLDTGAFVLAFAGLLDGYRTTVHYEHIAAFKELFPKSNVEESLFVVDRDRLSACGGITACDLSLEIIRLQHGINLANAAAHYIFHERLRSSDEIQQSPSYEPVGYSVPKELRNAIILMERNLEEPLNIPEIANYINISQRQLERLFKAHTAETPLQYYTNISLDRARSLVTQTEMPIAEIASACGFNSAEHFTRSYKKRFNIVPSKDRTEGRIPFQFRSYPSYAVINCN